MATKQASSTAPWQALPPSKAAAFRSVAVIGPAAVIGLVCATTIVGLRHAAEADHWVAHTLEVLTTLETVQTRMINGETGQRGYLLTGSDTYLDPWRTAQSDVDRSLAATRRLTADNLVQQRHLDTLTTLVGHKFSELDTTIVLRRKMGAAAALTFVETNRGKATMDSARTVLVAMAAEEQRLLAIRTQSAAWWRTATMWTIVLGCALAALLAIVINGLLAEYAASEAEAARELDARAEELQAQAGELEMQNEQLQDQARELEIQNEQLQEQTTELETQAEELQIRAREIQEANTDRMRSEEATRLKSEFLANMSHELRTPLNAIIGFTELLHNGKVSPESPEHNEYLGDVLTSARHLLQLINDVLDLSKIEAGKLAFHPEPVKLPSLVNEVLAILRTTIATKRLRVESHVDPELTDVVLDGARFKQVLYNYVSNAIKFTPEGGQVTVRAGGVGTGGGASFRLEVADTGIGIAPEDMKRLFVEFEQLDPGLAKQHGGTGLGLALTKRLVEAQGGTVGVESRLGHGSTFYAIFPRQVAVSPSAGPHSFNGARSNARTVLIVEDDARDQGILVRTLMEAGYAVETAATGAQALAKCRARSFDAVTLDLLLPDMSGLEVLDAIRSGRGGGGSNRDVPVIVVTIVTEHGVTAGFAVHDILSKPLDAQALLASLERAGITPERSGNLLVVDDDAKARELMAAALRQLGYEAQCVASGEHGLRAARESPPLAVVLDLLMPEMDGFEFLDRFRELPQCRRVPVIVWTAADLTPAQYQRVRSTAQGMVAKGRDGGRAVVEELQAFLPAEMAQAQ